MREEGARSIRRSCSVLRFLLKSYRYTSRRPDQAALEQRTRTPVVRISTPTVQVLIRTEFATGIALPGGFIGHLSVWGDQYLLDMPQWRHETVVLPHRMRDHRRRSTRATMRNRPGHAARPDGMMPL